MSTFLSLCQDVARESGTVSGTQPTAVASQTGRLGKIVHWTRQAWTDIQNARGEWRWMEAELEDAEITASTAKYTSTSFSLTRWAEWIMDVDPEDRIWTIYADSLGVSDEGPLSVIDHREWRRMYDRGTQEERRPAHVAVSPAGELCFGPIPDATYVVNGLYRKSPQTLSVDGDTPEMPSRFHSLITWKALVLLAEHDEGEIALATANRKLRELWDDLERDQLPQMKKGQPLA